MSDSINRADAIEAVATVTMSIHLSNVLCDKLLALPSADRPTGEWVFNPDVEVTKCNQCGWSIEEYVGDYKFCPNCGAKMKGGTE